jgi:circadian clock protein KaiB
VRRGGGGDRDGQRPKRATKKVARGRDVNASARSKASPRRSASDTWELRLYVAGNTPRSLAALDNLKRFCEAHLAGRYRIEVVDLLENPTLARGDQILAIPTLVRQLPPPVKKIIGDFSSAEAALVGLDLRPLPRGQA